MSKTDGKDYEEVDEYEEEEEDCEEGMTVEETAKERGERAKYFKMIGAVIFVVGPIFAWATYFLTNLSAGQKALHDAKFTFIYENQLGYVYLSVFIVYLARAYLMVNSNAARAPTDCERPDQHSYVTAKGEKVLMASEGAAGRFNRAQRAAYNMDEALPLYAVALVLAGCVFGPAMLLPAFLSFVGRINFGNAYKASVKGRSSAFMMGMVAETWTHGLVGLCALKGVFGPRIPF